MRLTSLPAVDTAFLCATALEAAPLLTGFGARRIPDAPCEAYAAPAPSGAPRALVVICGMGLAAAAASTATILAHWTPNHVVNCGIAGALHDGFAIGDLVHVDEVARFDAARDDVRRQRPARSVGLAWVARVARSGRLFSSVTPVFDAPRRAALAAHADLVDMEGAAIAEACAAARVPCALLKAVSDHADDRATLQRNLASASEALARHVLSHYGRSTPEEEWHERSGSNSG